VLDFFLVRPAKIQSASDKVLLHQNVSGGHKVILGSETGVQLDVLEGAGDAEFSHLIRSHPGNSLPVISYLTFLRFIEAVYAVEYAGLAGAVRADNSQYLSIPYIQAHVDKGLDTAKAEGEVFNLQSNLQFSFHLQLTRLLN